MKTKQERFLSEAEKLVEELKKEGLEHISWTNEFFDFKFYFDDEQPRVMTKEEYGDQLTIGNDSHIKWGPTGMMSAFQKGCEETHKRYRPLVEKLGQDVFLERHEYLDLIIKD